MEGPNKLYQPDTKGPFKCARCSADAFPTKPEYKKHYFQSHFQHLQPSEVATAVGGSSHTCTLCFATLKSKGSLHIHMNSCHIEGGNYKCDLCCCSYNTRLGFQKHYKRYHGKLSVSIPSSLIKKTNFRKKAGSDSKNTRESQETSKLRAVRAVNCKIAVPSKTTVAHTYNCELCQTEFSSSSNRSAHIKRCHIEGGLYKCNLCVCCYNTKLGFQKHYKRRHSSVNVLPDLSKKYLFKRKAKQTPDENLATTSESETSRTFNSRNSKICEPPLRTSEAYPYSCDVCQVFFSSTSNRNTHMKSSHVRGGKYKCSLCPCVFSSDMSRKTHHSFRHVANRKDRKVKSVAFKITSRVTSSRRTTMSLSNKVATRKSAINNAELGSKPPQTLVKEMEPTETSPVPKPSDELCCEYCNTEFLCQADVVTHIFKMHKSKVERVNMNKFDLKNLLSGPFRIAFPSSFHPQSNVQ